MRSKILLTIILFLFSILYLKESIYFIKEKDPLMMEIKEKQNLYNVEPIDAIITKRIMIPGINGKKTNINKTYEKMKKLNTFNESLIVFDDIKPNKTIDKKYDKVIIYGNKIKKNISIVIDSKDNITEEINLIKKNYQVNIDILSNINDYCIVYNLVINSLCIDNHQYTILGHLISNNYLNNMKEIIQNGIILVFSLNKTNYHELNLIIKYLKNNNYNIVSLDELIAE